MVFTSSGHQEVNKTEDKISQLAWSLDSMRDGMGWKKENKHINKLNYIK